MTYCFATNFFPQHITLPSFSQPLYIIIPLNKRKTKWIIIKTEITHFFCKSGKQPQCWSSLSSSLSTRISSFCIRTLHRLQNKQAWKDPMTLSKHLFCILNGHFTPKWRFRFYLLVCMSVETVLVFVGPTDIQYTPIALSQPPITMLKAVYIFK